MKYFGWIFLFFIFVYIVPLASRPLISPDEFRYAEIPREMIESGSYLTPKLLGVRYFEKPPMGYWLVAGSFQIFGINNFSLRFPMALAAGAAALCIWILVQQVTKDEKLSALSSIIYLSFSAVYCAGTTAVLDSIFSFFVIASAGCLFMAFQEKTFSRRKAFLLILTGICVGLAFLTKGFLAFVIPALTAIGYLLWQRRWKEFLTCPWLILIAAAAVIAPWAIAIHKAEPSFWYYFTVVEHFDRFVGSARPVHTAPWFFYLLVLVVGSLPAGLLVPAAGFVGKDAWSRLIRQDLFRYAICFLLFPLIFFSCSKGKLPTYLLPSFASVAILIAAGVRAYFNSGNHHRSYNWIMSAWGICLLTAGIAMVLLFFFRGRIPAVVWQYIPLSPFFFPVVGGAGVFAGILMLYSQMGNWRGRLYLFFFGLALITLCINWFIRGNSKMPCEALQAGARHFRMDPAEPKNLVWTSASIMQAVSWSYARSDIRLMDMGELEESAGAAGEDTSDIHMPLPELLSLLADPARKSPVLVILYARYHEWEKIPASPVPDYQQDELRFRWFPAPGK